MRITLTGASGFIGNKLVNRLLADRHELTLLTRKPKPGASPQYLGWDAMREDPPLEAFDRCDAVIHLAGEPVAQRWTPEAKTKIRESRVEGTRRLVRTLGALSSKPPVLISASAIGIYGSRGDELLTENSPPGHGFLEDVTVDWEKEAAAAGTFGIRCVQVRIGIVLGMGGALAKMLPIFRMGAGGPIAGGHQWMSWIAVDDLVEMFPFLLKNENVRGPVNGTAPHPVTNAEFTKKLAKAIGRPAFMPVPGFAIKLLYGEMAGVVLASQRVVPAVAQKSGFHFRYSRLEQALEQVVR